MSHFPDVTRHRRESAHVLDVRDDRGEINDRRAGVLCVPIVKRFIFVCLVKRYFWVVPLVFVFLIPDDTNVFRFVCV